ncbi:helix-turn-helix domain-containing protein [Actinoplanes sp. KI2]|uniref:helix-turn-helix domain-containing protein n=1 Tax=Actinoplanes sp. KI2 TaxID=2983315 RepID=UPI0021D5ECBD|nr:helix-turn-helix domain-containing protein [Actinoplanes sp. KI2]MCU7729796.1 helix-turn-helix domain-containing protein [Actinoplanes sp. KI2]
MRPGELLSVGEAAIMLRASRAQVVDLCARGLLPYVTVGAHRRLRRADVEALVRPALTREQLEQLWLHRAIAGKFVANPTGLLAAAAVTLRRLRRLHPEGHSWEWLDRWEAILDNGAEAVLDALTSATPYAIELRGTSPFTGILSEVERSTVLAALADSRRDRARQLPAEKVERVLRTV